MSEKEDNPFAWIKHITGPVGALVIAVFGCYYLGSFVDKMAERHFSVIDGMVEDNKEARKEQTENMIALTENVTELSRQVEKIKECCQNKN